METWDHRWALRTMADELNMNKETIHQILHEDLRKKKMCAKFVPHRLSTGDSHHAKTSSGLVKTIPVFLTAFICFVRWKLPSKKEVSGC
jgi:hypothetical protein